MVYKRMIERNGKKYEYLYENYRDENNKVKNRCLGRVNSEKTNYSKRNVFILAGLLLGFFIVYTTISLYNHSLTGNTILSSSNLYLENNSLKGDLILSIREGELIPSNTILMISQNEILNSFDLGSLVNSNYNGSYFAEGFNISGFGEGVGYIGEKVISPEICFTLVTGGEVIEENISNGGEDNFDVPIINETESLENETAEIIVVVNETESLENETTPTTETPTTETPTTETPTTETPTTETPTTETPTTETPTTETPTTETPTTETPTTETPTTETPTTETPTTETPTTETIVDSVITGGVVSPIIDEIKGCVTSFEDFNYPNDNQIVEIKQGSVYRTDGGSVENITLELVSNNSLTVVSTDYVETESNFGEDYLGNVRDVKINLNTLNLSLNEGEAMISLIYENLTFSEVSIELVNGEPAILNETLNETINLTLPFESNSSILQYTAIIHRPVKWVKKVTINKSDIESHKIEIPLEAKNISVKTGNEIKEINKEKEEYDSLINKTKKEDLIDGKITGNVVSDLSEGEGLVVRFAKWVKTWSITGNVVLEEELEQSGDITLTNESTEISVSDIVSQEAGEDVEVAVEYYTESPESNETLIKGGKQILISAKDELNYTNILAYTTVYDVPQMSKVSINDTFQFKLYWYATEEDAITQGYLNSSGKDLEPVWLDMSNETLNLSSNTSNIEPNVSLSGITGQVSLDISLNNTHDLINYTNVSQRNSSKIYRIEVNYTSYDLDDDGFIDYIEWIVPHLSDQVYEIIYITSATHLDSNRQYLDNIYPDVKEKDGLWSESINNGEYVRVTFEKNLTRSNDITIYVRANETSSIEVFAKDKNVTLAKFENISGEGLYRIYFTEPMNEERTFDLSINGSVEFDYIVDPTFRGYAVFDGNSDYVSVTSSADIQFTNKSFTLSAWVNPSSVQAWDSSGAGLVDNGNWNGGGFGIRRHRSNVWFAAVSAPTTYEGSCGSVINDTWQMVTLAYNYSAQNWKCYINGVLTNTKTGVVGVSSSGVPLLIGKGRQGGWTEELNGSIDEVMIFNRTLEPQEIADIYSMNRKNYYSYSTNVSSLRAYYDFDDTPNDWSDDAGNGNTGTPTGNSYTILEELVEPHSFRGYAVFDGVGDYVDLSETVVEVGTTDFSFSFWVNFYSTSTVQELLGKYVTGIPTSSNGVWFFINSGPLYLRAGGLGVNFVQLAGPTMLNDQWYHIVGTGDRDGNLTLYVNGQKYSTASFSAHSGLDLSKIYAFGDGSSDGYAGLNGTLDEVMYFSKVLNSTEISDLYNLQRIEDYDLNISSLMAYYDFDDLPNDWSDDSGYGNSGYGNIGVGVGDSYTTREAAVDPKFYEGWAEFNGILNSTGDYATSSLNLSRITGAFTISAWLKPKQAPTTQGRTALSTYDYQGMSPINNNHTGWNFGKAWTGDAFVIELHDGVGGQASATVNNFFADNLNNWTYVVASFEPGTNLTLYVNGELVAYDDTSVPTEVYYGDGDLFTFGRRAIEPQSHWNGSIDEVMIFDYSVTHLDVAEQYGWGRKPFPAILSLSFPIAYYDFDDSLDDWSDDYLGHYDATEYYSTHIEREIDSSLNFAGEAVFDGDGDALITPYTTHDFNHGVITFSQWIYLDPSWSAQGSIIDFGFGGSNSLLIHPNRSMQLNDSEYTFDTGRWYHVLMFGQYGGFTVFINGGEEGFLPVIFFESQDEVCLGGSQYMNNSSFNGKIDEFAVFKSELNEGDIYALYSQGRRSSDYVNWSYDYFYSDWGLITYYDFDDAPDDWLEDTNLYNFTTDPGNVFIKSLTNLSLTPVGDVYTTGVVPSFKFFEIKDSLGKVIALFDDLGNFFIKGFPNYQQAESDLSFDQEGFIIKNSTSAEVFFINSTGSLFTKDRVYEENLMLSDTTGGYFEIRNSTGDVVAFVDSTGKVKLKGKFYYNYLFD